MVRASVSAVACAARQIARSPSRRWAPMTVVTACSTGAVSAGSRMPASARARISAAAHPASRGLAGAAAAAVKSARISWVMVSRSQRRSAGRRVVCAVSMRDSSSMRAASAQAAVSAGGGVQRVWAAWAHSWIRAPQVTG